MAYDPSVRVLSLRVLLLCVLSTLAQLVAPPGPTAGTGQIEPAKQGEQALRRGDLATARRLYEQALAIKPEDARAAVGLAEMLTDQDDAARARELLLRVVKSAPDGARARRALARAYLRGGQTREALDEASRAVQLDSGSVPGHVLLASAMVASGEPEKAISSFKRALRIHPGDAGALAGLALAYATLSDPRTEQAYRQAIAADPRRLRLSIELADYLWRQRQYDSGNAQIEKVLRETPDNSELREYYGINLAEQRRLVDAAKQV